jgi:hypothetical protein
MRHRAPGINRCYALECLACLWIGHMMQEGNRSIEFNLGLVRATDAKVDRTQRVPAVLLSLGASLDRADHHQGEDDKSQLHPPERLAAKRAFHGQ